MNVAAPARRWNTWVAGSQSKSNAERAARSGANVAVEAATASKMVDEASAGENTGLRSAAETQADQRGHGVR